ncbi:hypothetical protein ABE042_16810 [Viridibacillus arvi]|jgi:hypothetical protein|uniref:hypothetical protein n=1 Tax=Viridibacillus arvi TaxID=263475 RepID=UPI00147070EC|nr:hypothetical protein [Viridibacillus arvi]
MEENKYAQLNHEQLKEINEMEEKLGVTLIAYDTSATQTNRSTSFNAASSEINPS